MDWGAGSVQGVPGLCEGEPGLGNGGAKGGRGALKVGAGGGGRGGEGHLRGARWGVPAGRPPCPPLHLDVPPLPPALPPRDRPFGEGTKTTVPAIVTPSLSPRGAQVLCPQPVPGAGGAQEVPGCPLPFQRVLVPVPPCPWDRPELLWVTTTGGELINERLGIN